MTIRRRPLFERAFPLDDIEITRSGDGRTVTAYAAMFASAYEVRDEHGHYFESINRSAFDRALSHGIAGRVQCLYNHGMTLQHTPSERFSVPLGTPIDVKPDGRGLLTVTRYANTPLADEVLELVRAGAITAQSFRGGIYRSAPAKPYQGGLALIERTELGLRDYGPAPFAVNVDAAIVGVRSITELREELADLSEDERAELLAAFQTTAGSEPTTATTQQDPDTPTELGADDESATTSDDGPSVDQHEARVRALRLKGH